MIRCQSCGTVNLEKSQYCDECGARIFESEAGRGEPDYRPPSVSNPGFRASVTSIGIPPIVEPIPNGGNPSSQAEDTEATGHARLLIERGPSANTEFKLTAEESNIGRWDADNGIFPDVDLDAFDPDAKVSRRHARIIRRGDSYLIEDLGSTNGTFVNRGRRLLPGVPQKLNEGDEIIVGKTFLRFQVSK